MQPYDASKEETLKAKVTNVAEQARGPMTTVALTVSVDGKEYQVMLASAEFLKEKKASFAKDDEIAIKGIKSESPRGLMIRAREITNGENTLVLLDKDGRPVQGMEPQGRGQAPGGRGQAPGGRGQGPGGPPRR
jgi:hypothetical protein